MWDRIKNEPALAVNILVAAIGVAVVFGVDITSEQTERLVQLAFAVVAILGGAVTRALVVPASNVVALRRQAAKVDAEAA
jgi:hypothetical protein